MEKVNVARGDTVVLYDFNLSIASGEHVAILGPNGCGKSTLIKTLTCECYPSPSRECWCVCTVVPGGTSRNCGSISGSSRRNCPENGLR